MFGLSVYVKIFPELTPLDTLLLTVNATDQDIYTKINFSISDTLALEYFNLKPDGGLYLKKAFDYELYKEYR